MPELDLLARTLKDTRFSETRLADGTGVLLNLGSLEVFSLNETALFLVDRLREGVAGRDELARRVTDAFEVDAETASRDVEDFVAELGRFLLPAE